VYLICRSSSELEVLLFDIWKMWYIVVTYIHHPSHLTGLFLSFMEMLQYRRLKEGPPIPTPPRDRSSLRRRFRHEQPAASTKETTRHPVGEGRTVGR
jgi:hypothetical protein